MIPQQKLRQLQESWGTDFVCAPLQLKKKGAAGREAEMACAPCSQTLARHWHCSLLYVVPRHMQPRCVTASGAENLQRCIYQWSVLVWIWQVCEGW